MSMYFLHRNGETTGPFAPGRIAQMIAAGEADENDQVCAHGTAEWIPAYLVTGQPVEAAPQRVGMRKKRPFFVASMLLGLLGFAACVASLFVARLIFVPVIGTGLILIVIAIAVDRPRWLCAGCGNRIEKTSAICPACRARIK